jgi:hypothetical protein
MYGGADVACRAPPAASSAEMLVQPKNTKAHAKRQTVPNPAPRTVRDTPDVNYKR